MQKNLALITWKCVLYVKLVCFSGFLQYSGVFPPGGSFSAPLAVGFRTKHVNNLELSCYLETRSDLFLFFSYRMRRFVTVTPKRGKPAKPKEPSKVPKPKKTRADADPPSEYGADDYANLMDHNEREDRSCSPEDDFEIPAQPEGDDFSSPAYRKWFGEAFAGLHFYKAAFKSVNRRLDRVEAQHQRLDREVTESFDSQNARIVALERQLLAINSDKQARILDDSINSSLSTLIIYDPLKVPELKPDTECNKQEKLTAALVDVMIVR